MDRIKLPKVAEPTTKLSTVFEKMISKAVEMPAKDVHKLFNL